MTRLSNFIDSPVCAVIIVAFIVAWVIWLYQAYQELAEENEEDARKDRVNRELETRDYGYDIAVPTFQREARHPMDAFPLSEYEQRRAKHDWQA